MESSTKRLPLSLEATVSALSIAPYFPFPRVLPVRQEIQVLGDLTCSRITFEAVPDARPVCSGCGQLTPSVHSYGSRLLRDLPLAQATVEVRVPNRKVRCPDCGIRIEGHAFVDPYRRHTRRFERAVEDLCRILPISDVAVHYGLSWHPVKEIDKRRLEREVGTPRYDGLRLLAVDEIAVHKGHRYLTNVLELTEGRIVWVGEGRQQATLEAFFKELTPEQRASIEAVAIDMSAGYRNAVQTACPQAALVYDLFHVVAKYGREVVDRVRLRESKRQETEEGRKMIKGSRYLLLKNRPNLRPDQRVRLRELLEANKMLNTVYILKDQLKRIWDYRYAAWARKALRHWCELAEESQIPELATFGRNLRRHEEGIVNHCRYPIHTGRLEGTNNKIKVIKRRSYGFRDPAYFTLKVKQAFPGT